MDCMGRIAVIGGGSWATALAKLVLGNRGEITWFVRRQERIDEFVKCGHNPVYLSDVPFDTGRIHFTSDIDEACRRADTLVLAVPSPYFKATADRIKIGRASCRERV